MSQVYRTHRKKYKPFRRNGTLPLQNILTYKLVRKVRLQFQKITGYARKQAEEVIKNKIKQEEDIKMMTHLKNKKMEI